MIGTSDTTGLASGPHLHFEYVPSGPIIRSKTRIDPEPCIKEGRDYYVSIYPTFYTWKESSICTSVNGKLLGCLDTAYPEGEYETNHPYAQYLIEDFDIGKHELKIEWADTCQYISYSVYPVDNQKDFATVSLFPDRYRTYFHAGLACFEPEHPVVGSPWTRYFYVVPSKNFWQAPDPSIFD
jgi:hypothetical protein